MGRSESWRHLNLKKLAAQWAYTNGFRCIGMEVRAPRSRFRVDVAAYRPTRKGTRGMAESGREGRELQTTAATTSCPTPAGESDEPLIPSFERKTSRPTPCRARS